MNLNFSINFLGFIEHFILSVDVTGINENRLGHNVVLQMQNYVIYYWIRMSFGIPNSMGELNFGKDSKARWTDIPVPAGVLT